MSWLDLFRRGESADDAFVAVAAQQAWVPVPTSGFAMLPPSHAAADMHQLGSRGAPHCAGRAYTLTLEPDSGHSGRRTATVSHLEVSTSDDEMDVYDMIVWSRPPGSVPRFEAELGAGFWNHHRLADRFGAAGHDKVRRPDGALIRCSRSTEPARAAALVSQPGWTDLMQRAQAPALRGCAVEGLGDRLAVFSWTGVPRKGRQHWVDLLAVARGLDDLIF